VQPAPASPPGAVLAPPAPGAPYDPPLYKRRWFWAGVGGAVAIGTVAAILAATGGPSPPKSMLGDMEAFLRR
jgi:hypothetical protein